MLSDDVKAAKDRFLDGDGDLEYTATAQLLHDLDYRHDDDMKKGRYRSFKHSESRTILTLREFPPGSIIGGEADKARRHVRRTFQQTGE